VPKLSSCGIGVSADAWLTMGGAQSGIYSNCAPRRPGRCPRNTDEFSATSTPAAASTLRAACAVASPMTGPVPEQVQAGAASASTRVLPLPAGPTRTSATRAEVSTWCSDEAQQVADDPLTGAAGDQAGIAELADKNPLVQEAEVTIAPHSKPRARASSGELDR
jgi:hypothetical protein